MTRWIKWHALEITIVSVIVAIVGALALAGSAASKQHQAFMKDCIQDHKQYECTAMWRSGNRGGGTYVVPVITPSRR